MWSGVEDGVLFKIAGHDFETVKKAEFLLYKLLETVIAEFEKFKVTLGLRQNCEFTH